MHIRGPVDAPRQRKQDEKVTRNFTDPWRACRLRISRRRRYGRDRRVRRDDGALVSRATVAKIKVTLEASTHLTIAECIVRAARGHERTDGGIAFSGVLWIRDIPVAEFNNDGNGGCTTFRIRDNDYARSSFEEFKTLARRLHPNDSFEQECIAVGDLWDVAFMRGAK